MIKALVLAFVSALWLASVTAASAGDETVRLGIEALESDKHYFELSLEPGESKDLTVRFSNHGQAETPVLVYAADVFSIAGGGLGLENPAASRSGATQWLDLTEVTLDLMPGEAVERSITVSVPENIKPGDYITSIVLQNAEPVAVGREEPGGQFTQTLRHGVAVAIDVPGSREPSLEVGELSHGVTGGRSVVQVEIANPGNTHLKPAGEFALYAADDELLAEVPVDMDSVYAGTEAGLEVVLDQELEPGNFYASLILVDDETGASAEVEQAHFEVGEQSTENDSGAAGTTADRNTTGSDSLGARYWWFGALAAVGSVALAGEIYLRRRELAMCQRAAVEVVPVDTSPQNRSTAPGDGAEADQIRPPSIRQLSPAKRT